MFGMMWFDNSADDQAAKIRKAAQHYRDKYGQLATLAYVNPADYQEGAIDGITVKPWQSIQKNHYFLGVGS